MAKKVNFTLEQGTTFSKVLTATDSNDSPIDLSGYTPASQMRKHFSSNTAYEFTAEVTNAVAGEVTVSLYANQTANMVAGRYVYDCEVTGNTALGNAVIRIVEGIVTISPEVTQ